MVDDSAVVRQALQHMLSGQPDIEYLGSAPNPLIAMAAIQKNRPDVLLLDIEMPGMDGLTFLRQIMASTPIPTVICSTLSLKAAALAKPRQRVTSGVATGVGAKALTAARARVLSGVHAFAMNKPVVIGSSTGGTQAIECVLMALPADAPGIAITQHMPEKFTAMYATRLNGICAMNVREAKDGDRLERGVVLIAPGGRHMQLRKAAGQYFVQVLDGPPVNRHKPSVDVLFNSAAECAGRDILGIIMTGMGDDGARGMKVLHDGGARTIAQNEETCVVFGMPKEAIKLQAVDDILPFESIARAILEFDSRA